MFTITEEEIKVGFTKDNGNDHICSIVAMDFLETITGTKWYIIPNDHEIKSNFDLVLSDGKHFECFEFKSALYLKGNELPFGINQIKDSNKIFGIVLKTDEGIDYIIFCQFSIEYCIRSGIITKHDTCKQLRYRFRFNTTNVKLLLEKSVLSKDGRNCKLQVLKVYDKGPIQNIINKENDKRLCLKKLFK